MLTLTGCPQSVAISTGFRSPHNCLAVACRYIRAQRGHTALVLVITKNTNLMLLNRFLLAFNLVVRFFVMLCGSYRIGVLQGAKPMSASHHFASSWSVEERDDCFVVRNGNGRALHRVYFKNEQGRRSVATLFTCDEARHLAAAVAKLPDVFAS